MAKVRALGEIARARGQSLTQMALAWVLRQQSMASALIGASKVAQVEECAGAIAGLEFTREESEKIDRVLG